RDFQAALCAPKQSSVPPPSTQQKGELVGPVVVIGLDACDLDLVESWSREGWLPVLTSLMKSGVWARLLSTYGLFADSISARGEGGCRCEECFGDAVVHDDAVHLAEVGPPGVVIDRIVCEPPGRPHVLVPGIERRVPVEREDRLVVSSLMIVREDVHGKGRPFT